MLSTCLLMIIVVLYCRSVVALTRPCTLVVVWEEVVIWVVVVLVLTTEVILRFSIQPPSFPFSLLHSLFVLLLSVLLVCGHLSKFLLLLSLWDLGY